MNTNQHNNQNANAKAGQLANAVKLIKEQISKLGERILNATAEEKPALEKEMAELTSSLGMEYTHSYYAKAEDGAETDTSPKVGAKILHAIQEANEQLAKETGVPADTPPVSLPKASLWERFKAFCGRNKMAVIAGTTLAVSGVTAFFYRGQISAAINPQGVTVNVEPGVEVPAANPSIFAQIGNAVVSAAYAIKGYAVGAWNWVCGLFTRAPAAVVTADGQPVAA